VNIQFYQVCQVSVFFGNWSCKGVLIKMPGTKKPKHQIVLTQSNLQTDHTGTDNYILARKINTIMLVFFPTQKGTYSFFRFLSFPYSGGRPPHKKHLLQFLYKNQTSQYIITKHDFPTFVVQEREGFPLTDMSS
jgi:hypothetical protein